MSGYSGEIDTDSSSDVVERENTSERQYEMIAKLITAIYRHARELLYDKHIDDIMTPQGLPTTTVRLLNCKDSACFCRTVSADFEHTIQKRAVWTKFGVRRDKKLTILSAFQCHSAIFVVRPLVKHFLLDSGIARKIQCVTAMPKNCALSIQIDVGHYDSTGRFQKTDSYVNTMRHHVLMQVELQNGELYALDLTGMQFGWKDITMKWEEYEETRLEGRTLTTTFEDATTWFMEEQPYLIKPLIAGISSTINTFPRDKDIPLNEFMLDWDRNRFKNFRKKMLKIVEKKLERDRKHKDQLSEQFNDHIDQFSFAPDKKGGTQWGTYPKW